ncbi:MAG: alternative ribosome rescue aminoacyl-tRNA hydrolase ArfB [Devosia sp.]
MSLALSPTIAVPLSEIEVAYIRSPGPGGQNVNKVATAAQLRFDLVGSPSLPEPVKRRAVLLAGSRLTTAGEIVITASRHRTQAMNRDDALARLAEILRAALVPPKPRRATRPTLASKRRRLEGKARRSATKKLRSGSPGMD